ncbi:MAG TPA: alpha/beta fold hydrolase [Anaeromyxobacter sp.]|nr:alpha/beta fold hydrolase [Anaeromyxobacter sp.]
MTPIAFLPGAGGRSSFWAPVAARLEDLGPTLVLGWPGFGDAPPDPGVRSLADLAPWTLGRLPPGASDLVAQSMGGVVALLLALAHPARVRRLVLCATSGGVRAPALGQADWRPEYRAELPDAPEWFVADRTDLTARLPLLGAPTLVLHGDADPICPDPVARLLAGLIPGARRACLPGADHMLGRDRPDEVAALIRAHLTG